MTSPEATAGAVRISVVVPSYNSGAYLEEAIRSALNQVPPPHEVLVQDGGSTDGSADLLGSFGDQVNCVSGKDRGQADALNLAIARATGDVIVWLNADDLLLPGAFASAVATFNRVPEADFAFGDYDMIRADGSIIRHYVSSDFSADHVFRHGCYIFSGAMFFRRQLLHRVGPFNTELQTCMDLDYLFRLGDATGTRTGTTVAQFRMSGTGKSSLIRGRFLRETHMLHRRAAGDSRRRRLVAAWVDVRTFISLYTQPVRMTRAWSAVRRTKQL